MTTQATLILNGQRLITQFDSQEDLREWLVVATDICPSLSLITSSPTFLLIAHCPYDDIPIALYATRLDAQARANDLLSWLRSCSSDNPEPPPPDLRDAFAATQRAFSSPMPCSTLDFSILEVPFWKSPSSE